MSQSSSWSPPDSYYTIDELAKLVGVSDATIRARAKKLGVKKFRHGGRRKIYFSPGDAERILASFKGEVVDEPVPGWIGSREASKRYGIHPTLVARWVVAGHVRGAKYHGRWIVDPASLEAHLARRDSALPGWIPVARVAKRARRGRSAIVKRASELGLPLRYMWRGGKRVLHMREVDAERFYVDRMVPVYEYLRERYGYGWRRIRSVVRKLGDRAMRDSERRIVARVEDIEEVVQGGQGDRAIGRGQRAA